MLSQLFNNYCIQTEEKKKEKSPNSPMPKVECKFSSISLPQPTLIPFFPGMVHGQMPCGRGGGGGGTRHLFFVQI